MEKRIKIVLFFAVWNRFDILQICLSQIQNLINYKPKEFEIIPFAVCSDFKAAIILSEFGIKYCYHENLPVGRKKNFGLTQLLIQVPEFDYLMEIGDDDLIAPEILDLYKPYFKKQEKLFSCNTVFFYDVNYKVSAKIKSDTVLGAARCMHRSVFSDIQTLNFKCSVVGLYDIAKDSRQTMKTEQAESMVALGYALPSDDILSFWQDLKCRGLDASSNRTLMIMGYTHKLIEIDEPLIIDLKSETNINSINLFPLIEEPFQHVFRYFDSSIKRMVNDAGRNLRSEVR